LLREQTFELIERTVPAPQMIVTRGGVEEHFMLNRQLGAASDRAN
jgi:hypothetical protein